MAQRATLEMKTETLISMVWSKKVISAESHWNAKKYWAFLDSVTLHRETAIQTPEEEMIRTSWYTSV